MKTPILDKHRAKNIRNLKLPKIEDKSPANDAITRKLVPGKSLEQIRLEAVQQLREIGLFI